MQEVDGSIPSGSTIFSMKSIFSWGYSSETERLHNVQEVGGSIPPRPTKVLQSMAEHLPLRLALSSDL